MKSRRELILNGLTETQRRAAENTQTDCIIYAGAGSGKTKTLVAHYLTLLEEGIRPDEIAAITFTKKAAREMRNRIKTRMQEIANDRSTLGQESKTEWTETRDYWIDLFDSMSNAQIGTIHGLCSNFLRLHPAEAAIDPEFRVLEEYEASMMIEEAVERQIAENSGKKDFLRLFDSFKESDVKYLLLTMIKERSKLRNCPRDPVNVLAELKEKLVNILNRHNAEDLARDLRSLPKGEEPTPTFCKSRSKYSGGMDTALENVRSGKDFNACFEPLFEAFNGSNLRACKKSETQTQCRSLWAELSDTFGWYKKDGLDREELLPENMELLNEAIRELFLLYDRALENYLSELDAHSLLDYDALEEKTIQVLECLGSKGERSQRFRAILVDEYQDTNSFQQYLVELLCGPQCHLYVVGDDKQSIYRFRRADVTVFKKTEKKILEGGGCAYQLDQTFRAHQELIDSIHPILESVMTDPELMDCPSYVPYSRLISCQKPPAEGSGPWVEMIIGGSRKSAADLLADRLIELKERKDIRSWGDVALLFRSSFSFPFYESALEKAGIPYITAAGQGFYDRPEIRDVMNILRCVSNPEDDNALCGFLLSPVIGFTTTMLLELKCFANLNHSDVPLNESLMDEAFCFEDQECLFRLQRVRGILSELCRRAGHIRVDELLQRLYEVTDYRGMLARFEGERLWRNLDKLRQDALESGTIIVSEFLDHVENAKGAGAREGEAPADSSGAVQLMTIHKSKGLGFPVVVLADMGRKSNSSERKPIISERYGLCVSSDISSIPYLLAEKTNDQAEDAENLRLFYVAVTRAQERLIFSGHRTKGKWTGWLSKLVGDKGQLLPKDLPFDRDFTQSLSAADPKTEIFVRAREEEQMDSSVFTGEVPTLAADRQPEYANERWLYKPLYDTKDKTPEIENRAEQLGKAVGKLVHKAVELELTPDSGAEAFLQRDAAMMIYLSEEDRKKAVRRALYLLERYWHSDIWKEIQTAEVRYHELPFSCIVRDPLTGQERQMNRIIDLLMKVNGTWKIYEFKTDDINTMDELSEAVEKHKKQLRSYVRSVRDLLHIESEGWFCFFDCIGEVRTLREK